MSKVFKDYQELISDNRSMFSFLLKNGFEGVVKATWFARQKEIEDLTNEMKLLNSAAEELRDNNFEILEENEQLVKQSEDALAINSLLTVENKKVLKKSKKLKRENKTLKLEVERLRKESVFIKSAKESLDIKLNDLSKALKLSEEQLATANSKIISLQKELDVATTISMVKSEEAASAKIQKEIYEGQAIEAKRHADEYREYVKELKQYAQSLKKYPWERRSSSRFGRIDKEDKVARMPRRATSLFTDM